MNKNVVHQRYPSIGNIGVLIDIVDILYGAYLISHTYAIKLASKYWLNMHVYGNVPPTDVLKHTLNNLVISGWFEAFQIEVNETEIIITFKRL